MEEHSQATSQPSSLFTQKMCKTTTDSLALSERIVGILLAQPLNPLVRMEMRSMGRQEQEVRLAGGNY